MIRAYVMTKVGAGEYFSVEKTIREEMAKLPGIKKVDGIFGRFDIIAEVEAKDAGELSRLVTDKIKARHSYVTEPSSTALLTYTPETPHAPRLLQDRLM